MPHIHFMKVIYFSLGQVAQSVEQCPEKACVGGSIPSLATNPKLMSITVDK